jgi:Skp family chaperone for outer membrane proteins
MKYAAYLWGIVVVSLIVIVFLLVRIRSLGNEVQGIRDQNSRELAALQESLKRAQADVATAKDLTPGLGEYMTTIQLHAGKLWFAAKAFNWELAQYELDELKETMEAAKGLNAEKNGVKISGVLDSVLQTQVAQLAETIKQKNQQEFQKSYEETLSACNGCHTEAGYKFIHIVRPNAPPVTNQRWEMTTK